MFYREERLAVMIDGVNLGNMTRALGFDMDFHKLRDEFSRRGRLVRIGYYTPVPDSDDHLPIRPLLDWLDYNGYDVVTRRCREVLDANGKRRLKGTTSTSLVVDAMTIAPGFDHFVLVSGDGDFIPLIEALRTMGKRTTIISTIATETSMVSDDLRRKAGNFVDMENLKSTVRKSEA